MKKRSMLLFVTIVMMIISIALSCKKDDPTCVECAALCDDPNNPSTITETFCDGDLAAQEAAFRATYEGCIVECH